MIQSNIQKIFKTRKITVNPQNSILCPQNGVLYPQNEKVRIDN